MKCFFCYKFTMNYQLHKNIIFAILATMGTALFQWLFWDFIQPFVWFLFYPAVFFIARFMGFWGGIASTFTSVLIVWYFFLPAQLSWHLENPYHFLSMLVFTVMGYFFSEIHARTQKDDLQLRSSLNAINQSNIEINRLYQENLSLDEVKFSEIANVIPQIVWVTNPDGGNIFFNQAWMAYTGLTLEESLGAGWSKPFHPEDQPIALHAWQNAVTNNATYSLECRLRRADGEYRWWLIRGVPSFNLQGKIIKWFGTCTDIHDLKINLEKIRLAEEKLRSAIDSMDDGILILDRNRAFVEVNNRFHRFFKYDNQDQFPNALETLESIVSLSKDGITFELGEWPVREAFQGKKASNLEYSLSRTDTGETWYGSFNSAPILDEDGKVDGAVMVVRDISQRKKTELEIQSYLLRLENVMQDTLQVLAKAVDMKDPYTAGHQNRVGLLAKEIALTMGMSANEAENLRLIGLIHDIGKIGIPAELLTKPTRITALEYELIKTHVQIGYDILKNVNFMIPVADAVLQHHERLDGSGYPNHLKGSQILLEARIIAVADVVEAMSSHRPYREALGLEAALADIESGKGTKYDPVVADACLKLFRENGYRIPNV